MDGKIRGVPTEIVAFIGRVKGKRRSRLPSVAVFIVKLLRIAAILNGLWDT